jgi:uncharacterized membrane protein YfcA
LVSGISHLKLGNVDKILLKKLLIPGILGGIVGAYILVSIPGKSIKPFVSAYLLLMGIRILYKAIKKSNINRKLESKKRIGFLALIGGFFDAMGGGGWGPIVTTTLVANGHEPRHTIGSVNLAEFFVTFAEVITFIALIKLIQWEVIAGLIIGGVIAAPLAALLCKRIPAKALMIIVGMVIIALSCNTIIVSLLQPLTTK